MYESERGLKVLRCIENRVPISVCEVHSTPFLSTVVVFTPAIRELEITTATLKPVSYHTVPLPLSPLAVVFSDY